MRKIIFSLSGIVMTAFFVINVANAQYEPTDPKKKAATEVTKNCGDSATASDGTEKSESKGCAESKAKEAKASGTGCGTPCASAGEVKKSDDTKKK